MAHARNSRPVLTARNAGLIGCGTCGRVTAPGPRRCPRCGSELESRRANSVQKVWAWLIAGLVSFIPANFYPMLKTTFLGTELDSTIIGGGFDLFHHGAYMIGTIVFVASIVIPVTKFFVVGYLAWSMRHQVALSEHRRTHFYHFVEFIGRWSMIDVFVVAILAALVNMSFIIGFKPGPAAFFFALSVACTMVSALALDPRLLWDAAERDRETND
jgi:paraquat-inducible protein A